MSRGALGNFCTSGDKRLVLLINRAAEIINEVTKLFLNFGVQLPAYVQAGSYVAMANLLTLADDAFNKIAVNLEGFLTGAVGSFKTSIKGLGVLLSGELKPAGDLGPQMSESAQKVLDTFSKGQIGIAKGIQTLATGAAFFLDAKLKEAFISVAAYGPALIVHQMEKAWEGLGATKIGEFLGFDDFTARSFDEIKAQTAENISAFTGVEGQLKDSRAQMSEGIAQMGEGLIQIGDGMKQVADKANEKAAEILAGAEAKVDGINSKRDIVFNETESSNKLSTLLGELQAPVDDAKFAREVAESIDKLDATFEGAMSRVNDEAFAESVNQSLAENDGRFNAAIAQAEKDIDAGAVSFRDALTKAGDVAVTESTGVQSENTESIEANTKSLTVSAGKMTSTGDALVMLASSTERLVKAQSELGDASQGAATDLGSIQAYQFDEESRNDADDSRSRIRKIAPDEESRIKVSDKDFTGIDDVKFNLLDNPEFRLLDDVDFSGLKGLTDLNKSGPRDFGEGVNPSGRTFGEAVNPSERQDILAFEELKKNSERTNLGLNQMSRDVATAPVSTDTEPSAVTTGIAQQQIACLQKIKAELKTLNSTSRRTFDVLDARLPAETI